MRKIIPVLLLLLMAILTSCSADKSKPVTEEKPEAKSGTTEPDKDTASGVSLEEAAQRSIGIQMEEARILPIDDSIFVTAVVKPNETRVAHLKPLSRGQITKLEVRLGDRVRAGQPLLTYNNVEAAELIGEYRSAVAQMDKATSEAAQARKSLDAAQKAIDPTKKSLDRAEGLVGVGAMSKAEVDRRTADNKSAIATADVAGASLDVATASLAVSKADVDKIGAKLHRMGVTTADLEPIARTSSDATSIAETTLRAPFSGVITGANVAEGEIVDAAQELLTVTDISTVWVQGDLYEHDLKQVRSGQEADVFTDAYPGETFHGRITYISDSLDSQTRTAKIRCEVSNPTDRLKLDMFAKIRLNSATTHKALTVPESAVQVIDGKSVVFIRENESRFEPKEITTGTANGNVVEVLSGIAAGDKVVTKGSFSLKSALLKDRIGGDEK